MIEYIEERILSTWSYKILNIIHDQDIHLLIERKEVCELILDIYCIHELSLESACRHIQYYKIRILLLDGDTDCLCKVCLTKSRTSEKEERVERSLARSS